MNGIFTHNFFPVSSPGHQVAQHLPLAEHTPQRHINTYIHFDVLVLFEPQESILNRAGSTILSNIKSISIY